MYTCLCIFSTPYCLSVIWNEIRRERSDDLKIVEMTKNISRVLLIFCTLIYFCYMFRSVWFSPFQTLTDRIEFLSITGYISFAVALSTFTYLGFYSICNLFNISPDEIKILKIWCVIAIIIVGGILCMRSIYFSKIESSIYWECRKEKTTSRYYTTFIYASNPRLCKE